MSRPRVRRTVVGMPSEIRVDLKASIASRELPVYSPGVGLNGIRWTLNASFGYRTSERTSACSGSSLTPASIRYSM